MAFVIPNSADAGFSDQAEPDSRDFEDILGEAHNLTGVLSGCAVTAQGTPDMTVAVAAGRVLVGGTHADVSAGNVTITAADGTNPRFDLVCVDSSGTKSAVAGTAAANPVFPDPAGKVVLAAVYVPASDTDIDANQIIDKRVVINTVWVGQGSDDRVLNVNPWTYSTGLGTLSHAPVRVAHKVTATDTSAPGDLITRGLYSVVTYGQGGTASVGSAAASTLEQVVEGCGNASSEHTTILGALRYDIGTGFTQTIGPSGRGWLTDWGVHGPIAVQPNLLQGLSVFFNNYYNGSPTNGPATGLVISTKKGTGTAASATHQAADTYPIDTGLVILGKSNASAADGVGFTKAIQIGGTGTGWGIAGSIIGTGIDIEDWRDYGIRVGTREASGTGPGIAVDSDAGYVVIGALSRVSTTALLEVYKINPTNEIAAFRGGDTNDNVSIVVRNNTETLRLAACGTSAAYFTNASAGDVAVAAGAIGEIHLGIQSSNSMFRVGASVFAGQPAALGTTATDGFLYIPSCAGTPTGTPTSETGMVPLVYDSTNNIFYIYDGSWLGVEIV